MKFDVGVLAAGGGVGVAGDSFRALPIDLSASWKGSIDEGWATLGSGSFFTGAGAFLKLGSFGFGFGAEKKEESDLKSLDAGTVGLVSFFTTVVLAVGADGEETATFFVGGGALAAGGSFSFRFFTLLSSVELFSTCFVAASTNCRHLRSKLDAMSLTAGNGGSFTNFTIIFPSFEVFKASTFKGNLSTM